MVQVRCPQCASLVEGIEGQEAVCGHCGFKAQLPVMVAPGLASMPPRAPEVAPAARPPPAPVPAAAPAATPTGSALLAMWGYILGIAAIATFFLATVGLPFAFGVAAVVLGLIARQKDRSDRRGMLGLAFGAVGILLAAVWIFV